MKPFLFACLSFITLSSCRKTSDLSATKPTEVESAAIAGVTKPAHVVVVILENKPYTYIVGNSAAPYINSLIKQGALFSNYYAITHPSYPNYLALFSGSIQGVISDACIDGTPKTGFTIYNNLLAAGATFRDFAEGLPAIGSGVCSSGYYVERHNCTTIFKNSSATGSTSYTNYPFAYNFWLDTMNFTRLQSVSFVVPNLLNDMHDGSVAAADAWIKKYLGKYQSWAQRHNSVFILVFDEDDRKHNNRVPLIITGQHIRQGVVISTRYNHYSLGRSLLWWFGANTNLNNFATATNMTGFWR